MSRSVKRYTCIKGGSYGRYGKVLNNRKVRRAANVASGAAYKRVGSSWDIWDWRFKPNSGWYGRKKLEHLQFSKWEWKDKKKYIAK